MEWREERLFLLMVSAPIPTAVTVYPDHSLILAPLSGYTDLAFRRACRRHGCRYAFTPLIEAGAMVHARTRTEPLLVRGADEQWLGVQLLGSSPERLEKAALALRDYPYDVIDLNMGCPVRKVTRRNAGAALCFDPDLAVDCIAAVRSVAAGRCVTAKIRILSETDPEPTVCLARRLEAAGVAVLTVHGRTVEQMYSGEPAWHVIRSVAAEVGIPVVANGGVKDCRTAAQLRQTSGCSRLMIARGAIGNPWIFEQIARGAPPPSHEDVCNELELHVRDMLQLYPEMGAMRKARKIVLAYLVGRGYRRAHRNAVKDISTWRDFRELLARIRAEGPLRGGAQ